MSKRPSNPDLQPYRNMFGKRLKHTRSLLGLSVAKLEELSGIKASTINNYLREDRLPQHDYFVKFANAFTIRSEELNAQMDAIKDPCRRRPLEERAVQLNGLTSNHNRFPRIEPGYLAGFTDIPDASGPAPNQHQTPLTKGDADIAIHKEQLKALGLTLTDIDFFNVSDNAMAPVLTQGDTVLLSLKQTRIDQNGIYAIQTPGGIWLRGLRQELNGDYTMYTQDSNFGVDRTFTFNQLGELRVVGRYLGHWHWGHQDI